MLWMGLQKLKRSRRVDRSIEGERIWYASATVTDGAMETIYQKSLCIVVGPQGIMFTNSFWLPNFLVSRFLVPWSQLEDRCIEQESVAFTVDGIAIMLLGRKVAQAVRKYSPALEASTTAIGSLRA